MKYVSISLFISIALYSSLAAMNEKTVTQKGGYPSELKRYGMYLNNPQQTYQYLLSDDGATVTIANTHGQYNHFRLFGKKITISDQVKKLSFDTYDLASGKQTVKGAPYKMPYESLFIKQVVPPTDTVVGTFCAPESVFDQGTRAHVFFDKKSHQLMCDPIETNETSAANCHLFPTDEELFYTYLAITDSWMGTERKMRLYNLNKDEKKFAYLGNIEEAYWGSLQHDQIKNIILYFFSNQAGYSVYDLHKQTMLQTVNVNGRAELLELTDSGKTVVTVANHYENDSEKKGFGMSVDSQVKLYDFETAHLKKIYTGPTKRIVAIGATDSLIVAVSNDTYIYVFDRKTDKLVKKIQFPEYFVTPEWNDFRKDIFGKMRILNNKEIVLLLNTAWYGRYSLS